MLIPSPAKQGFWSRSIQGPNVFSFHWTILQSSLSFSRIGLGVTFNIFMARLGLSVRISQIHFQQKNLSMFLSTLFIFFFFNLFSLSLLSLYLSLSLSSLSVSISISTPPILSLSRSLYQLFKKKLFTMYIVYIK